METLNLLSAITETLHLLSLTYSLTDSTGEAAPCPVSFPVLLYFLLAGQNDGLFSCSGVKTVSGLHE